MNLTYLLGAGASAKAVPIVNRLKNSQVMTHFALEIARICSSIHINTDWNAIVNNIKNFISFDTLAKKLWIEGNVSGDYGPYNDLKKFIQAYLIYEQMYTTRYAAQEEEKRDGKEHEDLKGIDERYYPWMLNWINSANQYPKNVNVMTWNYDFQMPLIAVDLASKKDGRTASELIQVVSPKNVFNPVPLYLNGLIIDDIDKTSNILNIYRPNELNNGGLKSQLDKNTAIEEYFFDLFQQYDSSEYQPSIKYAWEVNSSTLGDASAILTDSDTLVIIGYSFPLFNRDSDKALLNKFLQKPQNNVLKKTIYIQDRKPERIKETIFNMIKPHGRTPNQLEIITIKDTYQFFVPHQFNPEY